MRITIAQGLATLRSGTPRTHKHMRSKHVVGANRKEKLHWSTKKTLAKMATNGLTTLVCMHAPWTMATDQSAGKHNKKISFLVSSSCAWSPQRHVQPHLLGSECSRVWTTKDLSAAGAVRDSTTNLKGKMLGSAARKLRLFCPTAVLGTTSNTCSYVCLAAKAAASGQAKPRLSLAQCMEAPPN